MKATWTKWIVAAGFGLAIVQPAIAQDEKKGEPKGDRKEGRRDRGPGGMGGGMGMAGGPLGLLTNEKVADHLKMTSEEKEFAKVLVETQREEMGKLRGQFEGLSREERGEKMREVMTKATEETNKQIVEIIGKDRFARLKQVQYQVGGVLAAFNNPELSKELNITDEQKEKAREAGRAMFAGGGRPEGGARPGDEGFDLEAFQKRMEENRKKGEEAALALLTDEQKATWKKLIGEPIDFKIDMPMMGGRGPGGPGGGDRPRRGDRGKDAPKTDANKAA